MSGGWDSTLKLWDPRAPPFQNCVASVPLPGKVYTMSCGEERLVVGTSGRHVLVFDVRRWAGPGARNAHTMPRSAPGPARLCTHP